MKCKQIEKELLDYINDSLDNVSKQNIENHLHNCKNCKKEVELLTNEINSFESLPKVDAPKDFLDSINEKITQDKRSIYNNSFFETFKVLFKPQFVTVYVLVLFFSVSLYRFSLRSKDLSKSGNTVSYISFIKNSFSALLKPAVKAPGSMKKIDDMIKKTDSKIVSIDENTQTVIIQLEKKKYDLFLNELKLIYPNITSEIIKKDKHSILLKVKK